MGKASQERWDLRLKRNEKVTCLDMWGKGVPSRGTSKCKDPKIGSCLISSRNFRELYLSWSWRMNGVKQSGRR
jgi:hypothetical protein